MGRPYSEDLRKRIVAAVEAGASRRDAARRFGVSPSCAVKLLQRWQASGTVSAAPQGAPRRSKLDGAAEWLLALIAGEPDLTLEEIRARLAARGISAVVSTIWYFYDRHGISFKKNGACQRAGAAGRRRSPRPLERGPAGA